MNLPPSVHAYVLNEWQYKLWDVIVHPRLTKSPRKLFQDLSLPQRGEENIDFTKESFRDHAIFPRLDLDGIDEMLQILKSTIKI